ncbi:MAG: ribosomal-processing cysteine protease Prp [Firmicutes bacterium]|nr:ribosomal-processing cysteine protease Prp [Bacillota bacterium]
MIEVVARVRGDRVQAIEVAGHAGAGPHGHDLVCAAVSALVLGFLNSCEALCGVRLPAAVEPGLMRTPVTAQDCVQLLARSLLLSLRGIGREQPEFVRFFEEQDRGEDLHVGV